MGIPVKGDPGIGTWRRDGDRKWHYWLSHHNDRHGGRSVCGVDWGVAGRQVRHGLDVPPRDEMCSYCAKHTGQPARVPVVAVQGPHGWDALTDKQRKFVQQLVNELRRLSGGGA